MKIQIDWSDDQQWSNDHPKYKTGFLLRYRLKKAVRAALTYEGFTRDVRVSITFTDNEGIQKLNKEYRAKDAATDVLSFPMYTWEEDDQPEPDLAVELGDIVLSLEKADAQAKEYGHSFQRETAFLTVHSVLHLLGYDHERSEEEEKEMFRRQEEIMTRLGLKRSKGNAD